MPLKKTIKPKTKAKKIQKKKPALNTKKEIALLKEKTLELETRIVSLENAKNETPSKPVEKPNTKLGFHVTQKTTISGNREYKKWYATKKENGKQIWIYVGNDPEQAENKIKEWLSKRGRNIEKQK